MSKAVLNALRERHLIGKGHEEGRRNRPWRWRAGEGDIGQIVGHRVEEHERRRLENWHKSNGTLGKVTVDDQQVELSREQRLGGGIREQSLAELQK